MKNVCCILVFNCFLAPLSGFIFNWISHILPEKKTSIVEDPSGEYFVFVHKNKTADKFFLKAAYSGRCLKTSLYPTNLLFTGYKIKPGKYLTFYRLQDPSTPLGFIQLSNHFKKTYYLNENQKLEIDVHIKVIPLKSKIFENMIPSKVSCSMDVNSSNVTLGNSFVFFNNEQGTKENNSSRNALDDYLRPFLRKNLVIYIKSFIVSFHLD